MRYLTFALAKGRLASQAMSLLEQIGVTCEEMKEKSRRLIFVNEELKLKFFLAKADDVPVYVEYGAADFGVCGKDTLLEARRNLYEVLDLKLGVCRMVVAGYAEKLSLLDEHKSGGDFRVATKYPNIAEEYFLALGKTPEIIKLNGSVELAPIVSLADFIVDIVETGDTLKENGLRVLKEIAPLSARLTVNRVSVKTEHERVMDIIEKLRGKTI